MKSILILGGTMFVGRSLTEQLIASGKYDITLFNRGKSNTALFKEVKQIHGDRESVDIEKVCNRHWDCIIDFSGYYPNTFEQFLNNIKGKVGRYIFISTISVYDIEKYEGQLVTERYETINCTDEQKTSKLPDAYGEKKAEMERLLLAQPDVDKIIFRPSYIYGKYDWTERFYYWLYRVQNCARFLLPDEGKPQQLSLTNADDLVTALIQAIEIQNHANIYNTISTPSITIRELVSTAAKAYGKEPELIICNDDELEKLSLQPQQFPLLSPVGFSIDDTLWKKDFQFTRTPVSSTLLEMRDYKSTAGFPKPLAGLDAEKEAEVIKNM